MMDWSVSNRPCIDVLDESITMRRRFSTIKPLRSFVNVLDQYQRDVNEDVREFPADDDQTFLNQNDQLRGRETTASHYSKSYL